MTTYSGVGPAGAVASVFNNGSLTLAAIFSDAALTTPMANPFPLVGTTYLFYAASATLYVVFGIGIPPLVGTKVYFVSDTNGGPVNRKLTFTNGILTAET